MLFIFIGISFASYLFVESRIEADKNNKIEKTEINKGA